MAVAPSLSGERKLAPRKNDYYWCSCSDLVPLRIKWVCMSQKEEIWFTLVSFAVVALVLRRFNCRFGRK